MVEVSGILGLADVVADHANVLILLAALAIAVAGVALILQAGSVNRAALARRVELLRPRHGGAVVTGRSARLRPVDSGLVSSRAHGLTAPEQREVMRQFARIGLPARRAAIIFSLLRGVTAAATGAATLIAMIHAQDVAGNGMAVLAAGLGALAGWFVPLALVRMRVRERASAVAMGLPEALELLVICVEGGLALEDAVDRVVIEVARSQPTLADELAITAADLKILPSRDRALANLAERVDSPSVRSVVTVLAQTMRYGTPLAQALRVVAAEMRNDSLLQLEERANRLPVLLTVPMMIFIMPTIFLVVGGPTALKLIDLLWH